MPVTIMWEEEDGSVNAVALDIDEEETYSWPTTVTTHPVETGGVITDQIQLGNPKLVITGYVTNKPSPSNYMFYGSIVEGFERDPSANGSYVNSELVIKNQKEYMFQNVELKVPGKKLRANAGALLEAGFNALFPKIPVAQNRAVSTIKELKVPVTAWTPENAGKERVGAVVTTLAGLNRNRLRCNAMGDLHTLLDCVISDLQIPKKVEDGEGAPFSITFEQIRTVYATETEAPTAAPGLQKTKQAGSKAVEYSNDYEQDQTKRLASHLFGDVNGFGP